MDEPAHPVYIGTAGWGIPAEHRRWFPAEGSTLARYAARFLVVEINSSFYRPHRPATYARWAETVPEGFRFAVKVPKEITHTRKLADANAPLAAFLAEVSHLGHKLGPLLVQLPPSLAFDLDRVMTFLSDLRGLHAGEVVCEPRHPTWFTEEAERVLVDHRIARVAADPAVVPEAARPGGWPGLVYYRLHGSPAMYYSPYDDATVSALAVNLRDTGRSVPAWCIFDNTAAGAACGDALSLISKLDAAMSDPSASAPSAGRR